MMRVIIRILAFVVLLLVFCIGFVIVTDYRPKEVEKLGIENLLDTTLNADKEVTVGIFNIGYGGLDAGQDFFMDGGTGSKSTSSEKTLENITGVTEFLKKADADIYMIQEVDIDSARTYQIDEKQLISDALPNYSYTSTTYYKVPFVPVPFTAPLGKVEMDLLTLAKGKIIESTRYRLPNDQKLPDKYFLLDRCMMESVIPLDNGKNIVVFNIHLSAYDSGGTVKKEQIEWIENYIATADLENNYYVFGGDWNLVMTDTSNESKENLRDYWIERPKDFKDNGFKWIYDERINTVRELNAPYVKGETYERVIDGYLVSPNIEVVSVDTVDLGFELSDHNPVVLKIKLK